VLQQPQWHLSDRFWWGVGAGLPWTSWLAYIGTIFQNESHESSSSSTQHTMGSGPVCGIWKKIRTQFNGAAFNVHLVDRRRIVEHADGHLTEWREARLPFKIEFT
jgi:hypothetical protein